MALDARNVHFPKDSPHYREPDPVVEARFEVAIDALLEGANSVPNDRRHLVLKWAHTLIATVLGDRELAATMIGNAYIVEYSNTSEPDFSGKGGYGEDLCCGSGNGSAANNMKNPDPIPSCDA